MEYKFSPPKLPFKNSDEEINHLRKLISEKEKALETIGLKKESLSSAREVLAEYKATPASTTLHSEYEMKKEEVQELILKITPEEHDKQISQLVLLAKEKGIKTPWG